MAGHEWGDTVRTANRVRSDFMLSWVFLVSLVALLVNDLYLKPNLPGVVSGLLSDVAGMVFFPILLVATAEAFMVLTPGKRFAVPSWFLVSVVFVAVSFVVVKFTSWGESAYTWVVNPLVAWTGSWLSLGTSGVVSDPVDLLALLAVPIPVLVGRRWRGRSGAAHPEGQAAPRRLTATWWR
ncbi:MAG: hypothetical protein HQ453_06775 [Actinobacteria bacterium]|nr:hypothetical protein [Actinomycetota bacterium]